MSTIIDKTPVYINLDVRRRIEFNLITANLLRKHVQPGTGLVERIDERKDEETGEIKTSYDINGENLVIYLWACLSTGERMDGRPFNLSIEEAGFLVDDRDKATAAYLEIRYLLARYYGGKLGEARAATTGSATVAAKSAKRGRGKMPSE